MFGISKKEHEELGAKYQELADKHRTHVAETEIKFDEKRALAFKTMELEFQEKYQRKVQKIREEYDTKTRDMMEKNFTHMKDELAKLHTEGNANTKYVEKASLKMMDVLAGKNTQKQLKSE